MNSDPGGAAHATDQLENSAAEDLFGFRTATEKDLVNFFVKTGGGNSPVTGRFYIDDIYLEDTDKVNLDNPLGSGEPGTGSDATWLPPVLLFLLDE